MSRKYCKCAHMADSFTGLQRSHRTQSLIFAFVAKAIFEMNIKGTGFKSVQMDDEPRFVGRFQFRVVFEILSRLLEFRNESGVNWICAIKEAHARRVERINWGIT